MTRDPSALLLERVRSLPLFDADGYRAAVPDLGGEEPAAHFARHGLDAGAWPARPARIAARLGELARAPEVSATEFEEAEAASLLHRAAGRRLVVSSPCDEPPAVLDAGRAARAGFARLGLHVASPGESATDADLALRVCSPATAAEASRRAGPGPHVLLLSGLADPPTLVDALPALLRARAAAACDPALVRVLHEAGVPAELWGPVDAGEADAPGPEPGASDPLVAGLPRAARRPRPPCDLWSERSLDLVSLGPEGGARADMLGRHAALFARHACVLVHRRRTWILPGEPLLDADAARYLHRRTKLVLNVRSEHASGLDWALGVTDAMAQGATAVSTPCFPHPFLKAGEHYLEETSDRIPRLVDWLLTTAEGRRTAERTREAARRVLARRASPVGQALRLLRLLLEGGDA